jgi:hypothetical protein
MSIYTTPRPDIPLPAGFTPLLSGVDEWEDDARLLTKEQHVAGDYSVAAEVWQRTDGTIGRRTSAGAQVAICRRFNPSTAHQGLRWSAHIFSGLWKLPRRYQDKHVRSGAGPCAAQCFTRPSRGPTADSETEVLSRCGKTNTGAGSTGFES